MTDIAAASKIDYRSGPALAGTCADAGDALYCHFQVNLAFVGAVILCSRHYRIFTIAEGEASGIVSWTPVMPYQLI